MPDRNPTHCNDEGFLKVFRSTVYFMYLISMSGIFKDISNAFTCTVPKPCGHLRFTLVHSELKKEIAFEITVAVVQCVLCNKKLRLFHFSIQDKKLR